MGAYRRGLVDMRKRFRGNQPVAIIEEKESGGGSGGQLYGGKSAFADPPAAGHREASPEEGP